MTQCTRSVNPASLFAHSECELRAWVLCYGISLISTQRHLCSATEPKSFSRLPRWGWIRPFLTKSDPGGWHRAKEKKKSFLFEDRTFCHWASFKFNNGTFTHNASQHISLHSKLSLTSATPRCQRHTHMQMSTSNQDTARLNRLGCHK